MKEIKITDIKGFQVGQAENQKAGTGCTVILCRDGAVAGSRCQRRWTGYQRNRSSASDQYGTENSCCKLSGGSAYGLDAASGAMQYLEEHGAGFDMQVAKVPIVCGASLFDLSVGDAHVRPDKEMGYAACVDAENDTVLEGNHGAGTGASVGKLLGFEHAMKSGIGTCGIQVGDLQVAAIVAVNACGNDSGL